MTQMWYWEQEYNTKGSKKMVKIKKKKKKQWLREWVRYILYHGCPWTFHLPHGCISWVIPFFKWIFFCSLLHFPLSCPRSREWIHNFYIMNFSCSTYYYPCISSWPCSSSNYWSILFFPGLLKNLSIVCLSNSLFLILT